MAEYRSPDAAGGQARPSATDSIAERALSDTGEQAKSFVEQQRGSAARHLRSLGDALTSTARSLENEEHPSMASLMSEAAKRVETMAERLRDRDVDSLISDARRLARQQPMLFLGGAITAGFLLTRFLKSSESGRSTATERGDSAWAEQPASRLHPLSASEATSQPRGASIR